MSKTETTKNLEKSIWRATKKLGVFCCYEVTIGFGGRERVDYITCDTKHIWRCYEIKASKSDFNSKAAKSFVGHYNYYVVTPELYEQIKDDVPKHIGVYAGGLCVKKAKKQKLEVSEKVLGYSMIRSLYREFERQLINNSEIERLTRKLESTEKQFKDLQNKYTKLVKENVCGK